MSLNDALNVAVSGLNAQSIYLGNISDNVANSQTIGFKGTNTAFTDLLTEASATVHTPGAVEASPVYTNSTAGTVTQVSNPTSMAISGGGFFAVQQITGTSNLSAQQSYTRAGDFSPNSAGYLVNSTGYALDGYAATNGVLNTGSLVPLQVSTAPSAPVATSNVNIAANLPATPPTGTTSYSTNEQVYDATGTAHDVTLTWAQVATDPTQPISTANPAVANEWNLTVSSADSSTASTGPILMTFGDGTATNAGTLTAMTDNSTTPIAGTVPSTQASGSAANVNVALNFGSGAQSISLNLGTFDSSTGLTQYAGSSYQVSTQTQDGAPTGNYSSTTISATGDVTINYDNGTSKLVGQVPLVSFNNPNALQEQNGQAFTATLASGTPTVGTPGTLGTGTLIVNAEEGSNVDISKEFTNMIVAQRAYTANTKVVSTANQMLQDTLNMIQG
jgi:flagellar hook protein FlgE